MRQIVGENALHSIVLGQCARSPVHSQFQRCKLPRRFRRLSDSKELSPSKIGSAPLPKSGHEVDMKPPCRIGRELPDMEKALVLIELGGAEPCRHGAAPIAIRSFSSGRRGNRRPARRHLLRRHLARRRHLHLARHRPACRHRRRLRDGCPLAC